MEKLGNALWLACGSFSVAKSPKIEEGLIVNFVKFCEYVVLTTIQVKLILNA